MKLLASGCSFTSGTGIKYSFIPGKPVIKIPEYEEYQLSHSWVAHLANKMNLDYINLGVSGSSNCSIIRRVLEHLIQNKNDEYFVILAMTFIERLCIPYNITSNLKFQDYTVINLLEKPSIASKKYNYTYNKNYYMYSNQIELTMLLSFLKNNKIKYFIYDINYSRNYDNIHYKNLNKSFINQCQNFKRTPCNHFYEDAHITWAEILYNHLKDIDLK